MWSRPRKLGPAKKRVALVPYNVAKLISEGFTVSVERELGKSAGFLDSQYESAGAKVEAQRSELLQKADIALAVRHFDDATISQLRPDTILLSFLDPFNEPELVNKLAAQRVTAVSLEMIPRSTIAQKWMFCPHRRVLLGTPRWFWLVQN